MDLMFSKLAPFLLIGMVLLLLFALLRFVYREKFAESLLRLPDANRESFLKYEKRMVALLKLSLWPALLLLIVFPLGMFFLSREYFPVATTGMALFLVMILQEYSFRKWLIRCLEAKAILK